MAGPAQSRPVPDRPGRRPARRLCSAGGRMTDQPIYLLRHGQTQWNVEQRIQGHKDSALTLLGERQALAMGAAVAALLGNPQGVAVVASPLGRTRQTAALVCQALG